MLSRGYCKTVKNTSFTRTPEAPDSAFIEYIWNYNIKFNVS